MDCAGSSSSSTQAALVGAVVRAGVAVIYRVFVSVIWHNALGKNATAATMRMRRKGGGIDGEGEKYEIPIKELSM